MARLTNSAIDALGAKLRAARALSPGSVVELQHVIQAYVPAMEETVSQVASLGQRPTFRPKRARSIIDKLVRQPHTRLSQMQDIAGVRIVEDCTIEEQNELAERIADLFPEAKVIDRRDNPSFGYRAVHVIAKVSGRPVEIQVRTKLQDLWAQIIESYAAAGWGEQIRYGQEPLADSADELAARTETLGTLMEVSETIARVESTKGRIDLATAKLKSMRLEPDASAAVRKVYEEAKKTVAEARASHADSLRRLKVVLEGMLSRLRDSGPA